jgi:hypothetical protein
MRFRLLSAWIWTGLLVVACWIPGRWIREDDSRDRLGMSQLDKVVHGVLFAGFGLLWTRALGVPGRPVRVLAVGVGLAVLTELGQATSIVDRDADPLDAAADATGLLVGIGAARLWERSAVDREPTTGDC